MPAVGVGYVPVSDNQPAGATLVLANWREVVGEALGLALTAGHNPRLVAGSLLVVGFSGWRFRRLWGPVLIW